MVFVAYHSVRQRRFYILFRTITSASAWIERSVMSVSDIQACDPTHWMQLHKENWTEIRNTLQSSLLCKPLVPSGICRRGLGPHETHSAQPTPFSLARYASRFCKWQLVARNTVPCLIARARAILSRPLLGFDVGIHRQTFDRGFLLGFFGRGSVVFTARNVERL